MERPHAAGVAALALSALVERTTTEPPGSAGVHDPRPGLPQYQGECEGRTAHNGFCGSGDVDALAVVKEEMRQEGPGAQARSLRA